MTTAITAITATNTAHARDTADPGGAERPDVPGRVRRPYLVPVPDREPPFDDELHSGHWAQVAAPARYRRWSPPAAVGAGAGAGSTVLLPARVPAVREPVRVQVTGVPAWSQDADVGVRRTATAALPEAQRSASMLARALVEVLSGQRAVAQLRVHCSAEVYAGLADRPAPSAPALAHLVTVRVCEPSDGVAEVSAVFRRGSRVRAIAFRLQGVDGRWRVTALQVG